MTLDVEMMICSSVFGLDGRLWEAVESFFHYLNLLSTSMPS